MGSGCAAYTHISYHISPNKTWIFKTHLFFFFHFFTLNVWSERKQLFGPQKKDWSYLFYFESSFKFTEINLFVISCNALKLFGDPLQPASVFVHTHDAGHSAAAGRNKHNIWSLWMFDSEIGSPQPSVWSFSSPSFILNYILMFGGDKGCVFGWNKTTEPKQGASNWQVFIP